MTGLAEGTVSHEHKFDGCMYGLKSQYQETPKPIKKPWKIVTWGVSFPKLRRKCDHSHVHAERAGRETRMTQIYTKWIAKIIMKGINDHVQRNIPYVNVKVMKRWNPFIMDDEMKKTMSRDAENARSHPIKPVTSSACACREPDALDDLLERSLLHWHFVRSSISSTCSKQTSVLRIESDPDQLSCGLRPSLLLKVTRRMSGSNDLNSLGQLSQKRIEIAKRILDDVVAKEITAKPPQPFQDTRGRQFHLLLTEDVANQWIRFGMQPVVVHSAFFANSRFNEDATAKSLELAYTILQRANDDEKKCTGWEFIQKGAKYLKIFSRRCPFDGAVGLLMNNEIYSRLDEL